VGELADDSTRDNEVSDWSAGEPLAHSPKYASDHVTDLDAAERLEFLLTRESLSRRR
jgi:hypothetical protein